MKIRNINLIFSFKLALNGRPGVFLRIFSESWRKGSGFKFISIYMRPDEFFSVNLISSKRAEKINPGIFSGN